MARAPAVVTLPTPLGDWRARRAAERRWLRTVNRARLPQSAKRLAEYVTRHPHGPDLYALSCADAAAELGLSERSVKFGKRRLIEAGYLVQVVRGVRRTHVSRVRIADLKGELGGTF
jgi:hypothetical protein